MALSYREQVALAHDLGGKYELGYWKFPSDELAATFRRRVSGLEWTPAQREAADKALLVHRNAMAADFVIGLTRTEPPEGTPVRVIPLKPRTGEGEFFIDMEPGAK